MFYDETKFDLDAIQFASEDPYTCRVCGPWPLPGHLLHANGGPRVCPACHGTGKRGAKLAPIPAECFQLPRGRESFCS